MAFYEKTRDNSNGFFIKSGEMTFPEHFHRSIELLLCLGDAKIDTVINGVHKTLTGNQLAFIDSYDVHELSGHSEECYDMIIPERFIQNYIRYKNRRLLKENYICDENFVQQITPLFLSVSKNIHNPLAFTGGIDLLLALLSEKIGLSHCLTTGQALAYSINELIAKHYNEKIDLDFLARKTGYNKCYISKIINHYLCDSFNNVLNSYRYKKFTELQSKNDDLLNNIFNSGFNSVPTFYRYCKQKNLPVKFIQGSKEIPVSQN